MLRGNWRGKTLGSGSDTWKYWAELRAGNITDRQDWRRDRERHRPLARHLHDHGHASTMTGDRRGARLTLPGASSIPAADSPATPHGSPPAGASSRWCGRT
jgi:hypothetical protein